MTAAQDETASITTSLANKEVELTAAQDKTASLTTSLANKEVELTASQKLREHSKSLLDKEIAKHTKGNTLYYYLSRSLIIVDRF